MKEISFFIIVSIIKLLASPSYFSTDFNVHQHWLALSAHRPVHSWYEEKPFGIHSSLWTLDYPPLFAYFEWLLSCVYSFLAPTLLALPNTVEMLEGTDFAQNYRDHPFLSFHDVFMHRFSVVITDALLFFGALSLAKVCATTKSAHSLYRLVVISCALFLLDHIHFQYNGGLIGLLLLCIAALLSERFMIAATLFTLLVHAKHLYAPLAPVLFVFTLCKIWKRKKHRILLVCGLVLLVVFLLALIWTPLILSALISNKSISQLLNEIFTRLFPVQRGLLHAYWPANFWSLYAIVDIFLHRTMVGQVASPLTKGLVGQVDVFSVLPNISPMFSFGMVVLSTLPVLYRLAQLMLTPTTNQKRDEQREKMIFLKAIVLVALNTFMFGYHVHEKALLTASIPLLFLLAFESESFLWRPIFTVSVLIASVSVFPLLHHVGETLLRYTTLLLNIVGFYMIKHTDTENKVMGWIYWLYGIGLIPILACYELYNVESLPFLRLLLISVYLAIGLHGFMIHFVYYFFS